MFLTQAAKEARYDKEAVTKFFRMVSFSITIILFTALLLPVNYSSFLPIIQCVDFLFPAHPEKIFLR